MLQSALQAKWLKAQEAEKGHWIGLWSEDLQQRHALVQHEALKADFIFRQMTSYFGINPKKGWSKSSVLDVGCGPTSVVSRMKFGKSRAGVDPLKYPKWVYQDYKKNNFKVIMKPFEELDSNKKFDIIIFYNALQHFADLGVIARKCRQVLAQDGNIYLSEYLEVPTNEAHIQFLEEAKLDRLFKDVDFKVDSVQKPVRLAGLVERPEGQSIDLYIACLS